MNGMNEKMKSHLLSLGILGLSSKVEHEVILALRVLKGLSNGGCNFRRRKKNEERKKERKKMILKIEN